MTTYVPRKGPDVAADGRTDHAALGHTRGDDHRGDHGVGPQCESLSMPVQAMVVYPSAPMMPAMQLPLPLNLSMSLL